MAKMGLTVYRGVIEDGGTPFEATMVLTSIIAGMMAASRSTDGDTEEIEGD
ncbi:MAG: hypothetical protein UY48_C0033G0001 [Candidatus Gottesmanbacteria bacterium GW2011_GWB1_49_7]|uniref:Uncharacterized protein n=1 Tax=Candidatus Gottesmanbacteria bacterium GW2011_GWB1_49_7 TaxID=1618448 RepID=A0A0G1VVW6_9BACT|nr:MAG: hypothetical protein UY48_C0033G0001 [Candidatus Gottesmanbacteria bacterium GW2011_GWB1_49_7]